jgi:hypothetical protein
LAISTTILGVGFGMIWNLNYLAGYLSIGRLHDAEFLEVDQAIYGWFSAEPVEAAGMFPIFKSAVVHHFLESAYVLFFPQIFFVILVLLWRKGDLAGFFRAMFSCFVLALGVFAVYPVVGPFIFPETMHPDFQGGHSHLLMKSILEEYRALENGSLVNGMGYFIGLPSLHVAVGILCQSYLSVSRCHFWVFLPVNVSIVLATFLLGHHYVLDIPAGVLLVVVVLAPTWYRRRRRLSPKLWRQVSNLPEEGNSPSIGKLETWRHSFAENL